MRKTKIVCTLGPSTDQPGILRQLLENGMNVARFNFSHGDYAEHKGRLDQLRALSKELDVSIPAMLDTKGPEIRLGEFENGKEQLTAGQKFILTSRNVKGTKEISSITYKELRELSYMGASVLHEDAMFPVHKAGIPTNIRNTNDPSHPGTIISLNAPHDDLHPTITGIAGRKGFSVISIEKAMMNSELGFGRKVLQAFEENSVSFEHLPTGIDTLCVVVSGEVFAPKRDIILSRIVHETNPDTITAYDNMSIIATVGRGMVHNCGTAARLFAAMSKAGINVRMIDQGSSELSIIVGVNDADYESTIQAIYNAFVK